MTDEQALADFTKTGSSDAFAALVHRNIDLIYSTARRIVRDPHLADDVTQAVFIILARRAASIEPRYLAGWLVNTARLASREAIRSRNRQQKREAEAAKMRSDVQPEEEPTFEQIAPLLDDALGQLGHADRSSVVLRFLQCHSFSEVAESLGISEGAARKRVERAVQKLRHKFLKMGVVPSISGLAVTLGAHKATESPPMLATQSIAAISADSTGISASIAKLVIKSMKIAKANLMLMAILIPVLIGSGVILSIFTAQLPAANPPAAVPSNAANTSGKINTNDRLLVSIDDLIGRGITKTFRPRVDPSGKISLPIIGQLTVGGRTVTEAQDIIAAGYRDAQIINQANVKVTFDEQGAQVSIHSSPFQIGDHLLLHVEDLLGIGGETTKLCQVNSAGCIDTPDIYKDGKPNPPALMNIKIQNLTEFETEKKLEKAYFTAQVLANAGISVERISAKEAAEYTNAR